MTDSLPIVLVPSLGGSARLFAAQIPELWQFGPVMVADHLRSDSIAAIAGSILAAAPPRFALAGLSMGGYIAFEILRVAPQRVLRLALLDTSAGVDDEASKDDRRRQIAMAESGRFDEVTDAQFPHTVAPSHRGDAALLLLFAAMMRDTGAEAFVRQQQASLARFDSRPGLGAVRCPTLILVGADDEITPADEARAMARAIEGSRLVVVPDCGHLSSVDQPEAVTGALLDWMRSR